MKNRMKLVGVILVVCFAATAYYGVLFAQTPQDQAPAEQRSEPSWLDDLWSEFGPTMVHLIQWAAAIVLFAYVMSLALKKVVRQSIEKSALSIFDGPVNMLTGKITEMCESVSTFFRGAKAEGIDIRVRSQFLSSKEPAVTEEYKKVITLAETYRENGQFKEAIREYKELLSKGIEDADILSNLGICYSLDNNPEEALRVLGEAVNKAPEDPRICHNLGSAYYRAKKHAKAIEWLEKSRKLGSVNYQTYIYLGLSLWRTGEFEEAVKITKTVLEKTRIGNKQDVHWIALANNNTAYYLFEIAETTELTSKNGLEEARKMIEIACELEPENSKFVDTRGCIYLWEGKSELAYRCFERSLRMEARALPADHLKRAAKLLEK